MRRTAAASGAAHTSTGVHGRYPAQALGKTHRQALARSRARHERRTARDEDRAAHRLAEVLARLHHTAPRVPAWSWPAPSNATGRVVGALVGLYGATAGYDYNPLRFGPVGDTVEHGTVGAWGAVEPRGTAWTGPRDATAEPGDAAQDVVAVRTLADTMVASWIRQRCGAIVELARIASGAAWRPEQSVLSRFIHAPCRVYLDARGRVRTLKSLTVSGESGAAVELDRVRTDGFTPRAHNAARATPSPARRETGDGVNRTRVERRDAPREWIADVQWPAVVNATKQFRTVCTCVPVETTAELFARLARKLGEFLQGPCGVIVRDLYEGRTSGEAPAGAQLGSRICDLVYSLSPYGFEATLIGYLVELTTKVLRNAPLTRDEAIRGIELLSYQRVPNGELRVGRQQMVWTSKGLSTIERTRSAAHVVDDAARMAPDSARVPDLPVEHTPEGWRIVSIPDAYRVSGAEPDLVDDPSTLRFTSMTAGYVRIDDAVYEARLDGRSTRWHVVPPEGKLGVRIPLEFNPVERRWETMSLIGAGDVPSFAERYAARDAELRTGGGQDDYLESHAELYDPALLPADADALTLEALIEHFATNDGATPAQLGVLHQYIEVRRWTQIKDAYGQAMRDVVDASWASRLEYLHGLLRGDVKSVEGFRHTMTIAELMGLAVHGRLTPYEAGACSMTIAERMVRAETHIAAGRLLGARDRMWIGSLRAERIAVPGLPAHPIYEDLLTHFLHGKLTDTQRGALMPRIDRAAARVINRWRTLLDHIEHLRENLSVRAHEDFADGYDRFASLVDENERLESGIDRLLDLVDTHAEDPTMLGALTRSVELHESELRELFDEYLDELARIEDDYVKFLEGFHGAERYELPSTPSGSALDLAALYFHETLTPHERGALYARFRESDALDRIDAVLADERARGHGAEIDRGYRHPELVDISALGPLDSLTRVLDRVEGRRLSPAEFGRLSREADDIASVCRQARVDAYRHRIVTGSEFDAYIDAYLNPDDTDAAGLPNIADVTHEALLDMFRRDGTGARMRGRIARAITQHETEQRARDLLVLRALYAAVTDAHKIAFPQSQIPTMLHGLVDGSCFPLSAAMGVAMHEGNAAMRRFMTRVSSIVPDAHAVPAGQRARMSEESRDVLGAMATLALEQPRSPGALDAGEFIPMLEGADWSELFSLLDEAREDLIRDVAAMPEASVEDVNRRGASTYLIETDRHAMLVRVEYRQRAAQRIRYRVYEPNYGVLSFDQRQALEHVLRRVFESDYYVSHVFGHNRRINVYGVDPNRLGEHRVWGGRTVADLAGAEPFVRLN
ncbi:hypothetical protein [Pararobbsia silviterrae]|nr:hypothetical protein [Pararobbsia silviterrae]